MPSRGRSLGALVPPRGRSLGSLVPPRGRGLGEQETQALGEDKEGGSLGLKGDQEPLWVLRTGDACLDRNPPYSHPSTTHSCTRKHTYTMHYVPCICMHTYTMHYAPMHLHAHSTP